MKRPLNERVKATTDWKRRITSHVSKKLAGALRAKWQRVSAETSESIQRDARARTDRRKTNIIGSAAAVRSKVVARVEAFRSPGPDA